MLSEVITTFGTPVFDVDIPFFVGLCESGKVNNFSSALHSQRYVFIFPILDWTEQKARSRIQQTAPGVGGIESGPWCYHFDDEEEERRYNGGTLWTSSLIGII